jgi:hypothetical protein
MNIDNDLKFAKHNQIFGLATLLIVLPDSKKMALSIDQ